MKLAISFYENILGFKKVYGDEYWTSLEKEGFNLGLQWTEGEPVPQIPRDSHGAHAGATITLKSTHIPEDRKVLIVKVCPMHMTKESFPVQGEGLLSIDDSLNH